MFKFLFVMFFFFILLLFLMGFSVLRTFKRMLFGSGENEHKTKRRHQTTSGSSRSQQHTTQVNRKKIFTEDDGEYVEYEEVK